LAGLNDVRSSILDLLLSAIAPLVEATCYQDQQRRVKREIEVWFRRNLQYPTSPPSPGLQESPNGPLGWSAEYCICRIFVHANLFTGADGSVGFGPDLVLEGDLICSFQGLSRPFAVRPSGPRFRLISPVIMTGLAGGSDELETAEGLPI
jgi:hypothetical protein